MKHFILTLLSLVIFSSTYANDYKKTSKIYPYTFFSSDGKIKDNVPEGKGELEWGDESKYSPFIRIEGLFSGDTITNGEINGKLFGSDDIKGDFAYKIEYDKKSKIAKLSIKIISAQCVDFHRNNTRWGIFDSPWITLSKGKDTPVEISFDASEFESPIRKGITNTPLITIHDYFPKFMAARIGYSIQKNYRGEMEIVPTYFASQDGVAIRLDGNGDLTITVGDADSLSLYWELGRLGGDRKVAITTSDKMATAKTTEINSRYSTSVPFWEINYANGDVYTGTLKGDGLLSILNEYNNEESLANRAAMWLSLSGLKADELPLYDGVMTYANGNTEKYTKGYSATEISQSLNDEPVMIQTKKAGSILSAISLDNLRKARNIILVGNFDENDLTILKKEAQNLMKLDMSLAFITYSEAKRKEHAEEAAALGAIFSGMGVIADAKYNDYQMSTVDYAIVKSFTDLVSKESTKVKNSDTNCIIPAGSLCKMPLLTEVILPIWCSKIEQNSFNECPLLRKVKLPDHLIKVERGGICQL